MATNVFLDIAEKSFVASEASGTQSISTGDIAIGSGSKVFRGDQSGIWLGASKFVDAPFRVDMTGAVTATTMNLTGYIPTGGAAGDVNSSVTTINADKINISGSTNFSAGYNPADKVDEVGGTYTSTNATAAKVQIFPDSNTGIRAYASNGTSEVFKVLVGGTDVGDVILGNYAGSAGAKWDQSAGKFDIKGDMSAGNISGVTITGSNFRTASSGTRVEIDANSDNISFYNSSGTKIGEIDDNGTDFYIKSFSSRGLALSADASDRRVYINDDLDLNTNDILSVGKMTFITRSSNPGDGWALYAYSSGGTNQLRARVNNATRSIDTTAA